MRGRSRASSSIARLGVASRLWLPISMMISSARGIHSARRLRIGCSGPIVGEHDAVAVVPAQLLGGDRIALRVIST